MRLFAVVSLSLLLHAASSAQSPFAVGTRDVAWPNTGQGTSILTARVHYPATVAGTNAPVLPRTGGWPVVVFLHGFAAIGNFYSALGNAWAQEGIIVVLGNTSQFANVGQENDGRATFAAVQVANGSGPFAGAFDVQRIGLAGHSMGGGNVANVLAINPGYRAGFAFAPVPPRGNNGALVDVPLGIVAGDGDTITPPATNAVPYYQSLTNYTGFKFHYRLNGDCTHNNVAGLFLTAGPSTEVFERAAATGLGFFRHVLGEGAGALEDALGPAALSEPRLTSLSQEFERPQVWASPLLRLGTTSRLSVGAEPGFGGALAGFGLVSPTPTPLGGLLIDPAVAFVAVIGVAGPGRRIDGSVTVPNDPSYLGLEIALQALGQGRGGVLLLGQGVELVVGP